MANEVDWTRVCSDPQCQRFPNCCTHMGLCSECNSPLPEGFEGSICTRCLSENITEEEADDRARWDRSDYEDEEADRDHQDGRPRDAD